MKYILFFVFIFLTGISFAQTFEVTTDTVMKGYYLPLDTNVTSFHLSINTGKKYTDTVVIGNQLSGFQVRKLSSLPVGSIVTYRNIFILENGQLKKSATIRYYIGRTNTINTVVKGPGD